MQDCVPQRGTFMLARIGGRGAIEDVLPPAARLPYFALQPAKAGSDA